MLTILEVGQVDGDRARNLQACPDPEVRWVLVQPDRATWTEARGRDLIIEHVEAPLLLPSSRVASAQSPSPPEAKRSTRVRGRALRDLIQLHRPAAIACGSPLLLPSVIQLASGRLLPRPALIGVWHTDVTSLVHRELARIDSRVAELGARASTWWATRGLASLDAVFVGSRRAARRLWAHGVDRLYLTRRGVDVDEFCPTRRDRIGELVGDRPRPIIAVGLGPEVDASALRRIHAGLQRSLTIEPVLVIVDRSSGEHRARLARFAAGMKHVHLPDCSAPSERARWLASCDLAVILTGGDSICAEAMASGLPIIGVAGPDTGSLGADRVAELIEEAGCGRVLAEADPDAIADAFVQLCRSDAWASLGQRARSHAMRMRMCDCLARERLCLREVIEIIRAGERVPVGIHERMQPAELRD
jgi:glycosyltransferase involved in cell wall biosynthesis